MNAGSSLFFVKKGSVKGDFGLSLELMLLSFNLKDSHGVKYSCFILVRLFSVLILGEPVLKEVFEILFIVFYIIMDLGIGIGSKNILGVS